MRKMLKASSLLICAMLLFSACAGSLNLRPGPFRSEMQDVFVQQTTLTVPASHAEHGEDYVIEWQDPVMEKHVRKWLDRPKGDIYHSDVWDYQRVSINSGTGVGDLIVKDAPDGVDIGRNVNTYLSQTTADVRSPNQNRNEEPYRSGGYPNTTTYPS